MAGQRTLLVDLGSTSLKAALRAPDGAVEMLAESPAPEPASGAAGAGAGSSVHSVRHETDPRAFLNAVRSFIDLARERASDVNAVALSTQMHGALVTDAEDRPLSPYFSWQDERAAEPMEASRGGESIIERVTRALGPGELSKHGVRPRVGLGALTVARWATEHPLPRRSRLHTLGSFVLCQLGGPYVTHVTNAASLGVLRRDHRWSDTMIEALGLSGIALPGIRTGFEPVGVGTVAGRTYILYPDIGDHQASLLASGLNGDDLAVSLGTAGIAARVRPAGIQAPEGFEVRPFFGHRELHVRSRLPGGRLARERFRRAGNIDEQVFWVNSSNSARQDPDGDDAAFFAQYTATYRAAMSGLFPDAPPWRVVLNGGAAQYIPWFQSTFAQSLGARESIIPTGDLALEGLAVLLEREGPRSAEHDPTEDHAGDQAEQEEA